MLTSMFWTVPIILKNYTWFSLKFYFFFNFYFYNYYYLICSYAFYNWDFYWFNKYFRFKVDEFYYRIGHIQYINYFIHKRYYSQFYHKSEKFFKPGSCYFFELNNSVYIISLFYYNKRSLNNHYKNKEVNDIFEKVSYNKYNFWF